jgi:hypothetical protein
VEHVIYNLEVAREKEHVSSNLEKAMLSMLCETCDCSLEEAGEEEHVSDNLEKARLIRTFNLAVLKEDGEEEPASGNFKKANLSRTCD